MLLDSYPGRHGVFASEGWSEALTMMAGRHNVLAIQGTNGLSDAGLAFFKAHGVRKVGLLMDGDEAGGKAVAKLRPRLAAEGIEVGVKAL